MNYFNTNTDIKQMSIDEIRMEIAECEKNTDWIFEEMKQNEDHSLSYVMFEWKSYEERLKRRLFDLEVSHATV